MGRHRTLIAVTHGMRRNIGDALIHARALAILRETDGGAHQILSIDRASTGVPPESGSWEGLVCAGGPGLRPDATESAFPVIQGLPPGVPVFMLAQGYSGFPRVPSSSYFDPATIRVISEKVSIPISVRDQITYEVCEKSGLGTVLTGCVAWYHLPSLGQDLSAPTDISRIVFTPPAGPRWAGQAAQVLRRVREIWPDAEILCSFHRGMTPGNGTSFKQSASYFAMAAAAKRWGAKLYDASGADLDKIGCYLSYDLHVGYRVHAHLDFLSRRRPSLLISEDGRGEGQNISLGDPHNLHVSDASLPTRVKEALLEERSGDWKSSANAIARIDSCWPDMQRYVAEIFKAV